MQSAADGPLFRSRSVTNVESSPKFPMGDFSKKFSLLISVTQTSRQLTPWSRVPPPNASKYKKANGICTPLKQRVEATVAGWRPGCHVYLNLPAYSLEFLLDVLSNSRRCHNSRCVDSPAEREQLRNNTNRKFFSDRTAHNTTNTQAGASD